MKGLNSSVRLIVVVSLLTQLLFSALGHVSVAYGESNEGLRYNRIANPGNFTLFVKTNGTVSVVGRGDYVLGTGVASTTNYSVLNEIPNLSNVKEISANTSSAFALLNDGTVKAWGSNSCTLGAINSTSASPVTFPQLEGIKRIAVGGNFAAALTESGTVVTWGCNNYGQLGLGNTSNSPYPKTVPNLSDVADIAVGTDFMLAKMNDGSVKSWGNFSNGQLGIGNITVSQTSPVEVAGLTNVKEITTGSNFSFAVLIDGSVMGWGYNLNGQLGTGTTTAVNSPAKITDLSNVDYIAAGINHTWASTTNGDIYVWGNNSSSQLGIKSTLVTNQLTPKLFQQLGSINSIYLGSNTSFVTDQNNQTWALGLNNYSQLGLEDKVAKDTLTMINDLNVSGANLEIDVLSRDLSMFSSPFTATSHMLANDKLYSWGKNTNPVIDPDVAGDLSSPRMITRVGDVKQITYGEDFALALTKDGKVKSWGVNTSGQLGLGDTINRTDPTTISGLTGVKKLVAASGFAVALMQDGTVATWGRNTSAQLGQGDLTNRTTPKLIPNLQGVKDITAGINFVVALMENGSVWVWGGNEFGQLGLGNFENRSIPTELTSVTGVKEIASGFYHVIVLKEDGLLQVWGRNNNGQLGLGNSVAVLKPTPLPINVSINQVAVTAYSSYVLTQEGKILSWGLNSSGELGHGDTASRTTPVEIMSTGDRFSSIITGRTHLIAISKDGSIRMAGNNANGQLGLGDTANRNKLTVLYGNTKSVQDIITDGNNTFILFEDGTVWGTGRNNSGYLGVGDAVSRTNFVPINGLSNVQKIALGSNFVLALLKNGTVMSWGLNESGQLGNGTTIASTKPVLISTASLSNVKDIFVKGTFAMALLKDGTVKSWGSNSNGQLGLGDNTNKLTPTLVNITGVKEIALGENFTLALLNSGLIKGWGYNSLYSLGTGNTTSYNTPVDVPNLADVASIYTDGYSSFALLNDGTVSAWGQNDLYQLGVNNTSSVTKPTQIANLSSVKSLVVNGKSVFAILNDGTLKAWGNNVNGKLGLQSTAHTFSPTTVPNLSNVSSVSVSDQHVLAVDSKGALYAWGSNGFGQLGTGDRINLNSPQKMIHSEVSLIKLAPNQSYAIISGRLNVWGLYANSLGLGSTGSTANRLKPEIVKNVEEWRVLPQESYGLKIKYKAGASLTIRSYMDSNTSISEAVTISMPSDTHTISFPVNVKDLKEGQHTIRFEVTDGLIVAQQTISVWIYDSSLIPSMITETTNTTIKVTENIAGNNKNFASSPIRFSANNITTSWFTDRSTLSNRVISSAIGKLGGNGTKGIVVTANGKWIVPIYYSATNEVRFYMSANQGQNWTILCTLSGLTSNAAITTVGNKVFGIVRKNANEIAGFSFDVDKQTNVNIASLLKSVDFNQTDIPAANNVAIVAKDDAVHAAWVSKNSQYPYAYNIRYAKIAEDGSALTAIEQVTTSTSSYDVFSNPSMIINNSGIPVLFYDYQNTNNNSYSVYVANRVNSAWQQKNLEPISSYWTGDVNAAVDKNNDVHIVWTKRTSDGYNHIFYTKQNTNGVYSPIVDLTAGLTTYNQQQPTLTVGQNNDVFLYFSGIDPTLSTTNYNIRMRMLSNETWSVMKTITANTASDATAPAVISNALLPYPGDPIVVFEHTSSGVLVSGSMQRDDYSYTFANLTPNTKYKVKLEVRNMDGAVTSITKDVYTKATTPVLTSSPFSDGTVEFTVTDNNPGTTKYQLKAGNKYVSAEGTLTAYPTWITLNNKKVKVKGLAAGKSYRFQAQAINEEEEETSLSNTIQIGPPPAPPATPTGVKATTTNSTIVVTWNAVPEATSYQIEMNNMLISVGNTLSYTSQLLAPNTVNSFRVRSERDGIYGAWTELTSVRTSMIPPEKPALVSATASSKSVTVTWNSVSDALRYDLLWDGVIIALGKTTTYQVKDLVPGTKHTFQIRSVSGGGNSGWSAVQTVDTKVAAPSTVLVLTVDTQDTSVQLSWTEDVDASGYEIEADGLLIRTGKLNYIEIKGLTPHTNHQYRVHAVNEIGSGNWSQMAEATTYLLKAPGNITDTSEETSIEYNWMASPNATSYDVEFDNQIHSVQTTTFKATGLLIESNHKLRVRASNATGKSAWSEVNYSSTLPQRPIVPSQINVIPNNNSVYLSWGQVAGSTGYDIELDGIVVVDAFNETSYTDTELETFSLHTYRIRSRNDAIAGEWSPLVTVRTLPDKPGLVSGVVINSTNNIANVTWKPDPTATGYDIEVDGKVSNIGLKTSYKHHRVAPGSEHKYRIRMRNLVGVGEWSDLIVNNTLTARLTKGQSVDLGLTASNVTDFSRYTLMVNYDPNAIEILDLSTMTGKPELSPGKIEGTDITITQFTPGSITFVCDKTILNGESWSGIINSIKMKAKVNGGSSLTYTVFVK
ncbi:fibronectin type III domain-containing protein [Paenibacillus paeoniae]|uniref:Fibronectin type-III domain-containing protein n=1 Tax=Paenibacillus paeoniae TaxID=2292705 RepID=A0A371PHD1_9BACL|nr:hypothetical protein [Paenibacillus paeoniae]REK75632.1 hypothetical protein DX130_00640 [Paenibacillus paeoniae]